METQKHLYRSRDNRMVAGVCGGIAEYIGVDPTIVRLVALVSVMFGGAGLLAYFIAWIIMPEEPLTNPTETHMSDHTSKSTNHDHDASHEAASEAKPRRSSEPSQQGRMIGGLMLIVVGAVFLIQQVADINVWRYAWPLILIVLGLVFLARRG